DSRHGLVAAVAPGRDRLGLRRVFLLAPLGLLPRLGLLAPLRRLTGLRRRAVLLRGGEVPRGDLLLALEDRVRDHARDEAARADRVVVPGNDVVRLVRIAVRVDERDDRQAEQPSLARR